MVEAGDKEVDEEVMLDAILYGHEEIKRLVEFQEEIIAAHGVEKAEVILFDEDAQLTEKIEAEAKEKLIQAIQVKEKHAREDANDQVKEDVLEQYEEEEENDMKRVKMNLEHLVKKEGS